MTLEGGEFDVWSDCGSWDTTVEPELLRGELDEHLLRAFGDVVGFHRTDRVSISWFEDTGPMWGFPRSRRTHITTEEEQNRDIHFMGPEIRAQLGREAIDRRGERWLTQNYGKFVAVTIHSHRLLAVADSLEEVYEVLSMVQLKEDCYVERVGFTSVGSLL